MTRVPPLGILIGTSTPPGDVGALAARAEKQGFSEGWVAEEYFGYGGFAGTSLALAATDRIGVGLGIVSATGRHPAVTAMEVASLAAAFPGRLTVAIGHGPSWRLGLRPASPLGSLEEALVAIRRLLAGEEVDGVGEHFAFHHVKLPYVPDHPVPLLTGVMRPRSLELSGRIADGTVMSILAGTRYLRESAVRIRRGMDRGGRTEHALPTYALCHVGDSKAEARAVLRPLVAYYLARLGAANPLSGAYGYGSAISAAIAQGGPEALEREMPDSWIDALAIAGDAHDVASGILAYAAAGATSVIAVPVREQAGEQLDRFGTEVLPLLGQAGLSCGPHAFPGVLVRYVALKSLSSCSAAPSASRRAIATTSWRSMARSSAALRTSAASFAASLSPKAGCPSASRHTRTVPPPLMRTAVPPGSTPAATALNRAVVAGEHLVAGGLAAVGPAGRQGAGRGRRPRSGPPGCGSPGDWRAGREGWPALAGRWDATASGRAAAGAWRRYLMGALTDTCRGQFPVMV